MGRGANFLIPAKMRTLGLCLVAPLEARVKNVMRDLRLSEEKARENVTRMEGEQCLWIRKHGHAEIADATRYHLVINTALVTPDAIVRIVKGILR